MSFGLKRSFGRLCKIEFLSIADGGFEPRHDIVSFLPALLYYQGYFDRRFAIGEVVTVINGKAIVSIEYTAGG